MLLGKSSQSFQSWRSLKLSWRVKEMISSIGSGSSSLDTRNIWKTWRLFVPLSMWLWLKEMSHLKNPALFKTLVHFQIKTAAFRGCYNSLEKMEPWNKPIAAVRELLGQGLSCWWSTWWRAVAQAHWLLLCSPPEQKGWNHFLQGPAGRASLGFGLVPEEEHCVTGSSFTRWVGSALLSVDNYWFTH